MRVVTKDEFEMKNHQFAQMVRDGEIFVYPTDTIYGIGCDATNHECVKKVREIKQRPDMPFSIIAPSKEWIRDNCEVDSIAEEWIGKLPGPYTLVLKLRNKKAVSRHVNNGLDTIGVRIPDHWISGFVSSLNKPIVTTSANVSGNEFMTSIDDLDSKVHSKLNFVLYEGEKKGKPSQVVMLDAGVIQIKRKH